MSYHRTLFTGGFGSKKFFLLKSISNKVYAEIIFTQPVCSYFTLRITHRKALSDCAVKTSGCKMKAAPLN